MNLVGIQLTDLDEFLHLRNGNFSTCRDHWIKIAGSFAIDEIARSISFPRLDQCEIGSDSWLHHILFFVKNPGFSSGGKERTYGGAGEKCWDTGPSCPYSFGKGALGHQFQFNLPGQHLTLKLPILSNIGSQHFADLPAL